MRLLGPCCTSKLRHSWRRSLFALAACFHEQLLLGSHRPGAAAACRHFTGDPVTSMPDVTELALHDGDEFLVVGSDGLWDVLDSQVRVCGYAVVGCIGGSRAAGGMHCSQPAPI